MRFLLVTFVSLSSLLVVASYSNVKMACLVNSERSKRGLQALGIDSRLTQAAQAHCNDQAKRRQMTHTGSDGSDPGKRCTRAGFQWNAVAENVAYGYKDETSCMAQWMQSPGHRQNILGNYQMFGSAVAYAGSTPYYTQDFGTDKQGRRNVPKCDGNDADASYPDNSGGGNAGDDSPSYGGGNTGGGKKGRGGKVKAQKMNNSYGGNDDFSGNDDNSYGGNDNSYGGMSSPKKGRGKWNFGGNKGGKKFFGDNDDFFGNDDDSFGGHKKFKNFGGNNFGGKNFFGDNGKKNFGGQNFGKGQHFKFSNNY